MFDCPKCSSALGHCPNYCDFCGEKIPADLIYRQRIREDIGLAKFEEFGGASHLATRINPVEPCNAFTHWSTAYSQKQMSAIAADIFSKLICFCGNCGIELPDVSEMDDAEIIEKLEFFHNESQLDE